MDDIVYDVLRGLNLPANSIVNIWFERSTQGGISAYRPIFDYVNQMGLSSDGYSDKMKAYIEKKCDQYSKFFVDASAYFHNVRNHDDMENMLNKSERRFSVSDVNSAPHPELSPPPHSVR
ncbi:MAG: hypothetical protein Q4Q58_03815, partial [Thermoplasmata archaeon]|nr:hypothetical protein [Thermoplasmata archaeon]